MTIAVTLRDVLQDDPPVALHVDGPGDLGVVHLAGAEVALGADPVAGVVLAGALAGAGVVLVVKALLLGLSDTVDEVVGALVGDVGVLLEEERVLGDLEGDVVGGVLLVHDAEGEVGALGALGGRLGVTVTIARSGVGGGGAVGSGVDSVVGGGVVDRVDQLVRPYQCRDEDEETCNLATKSYVRATASQHHTRKQSALTKNVEKPWTSNNLQILSNGIRSQMGELVFAKLRIYFDF